MEIGSIQGKYGRYPVLVINGDLYYRDSSSSTVATGFHKEPSGRYTGPDGSSYAPSAAVREIQSRYSAGRYA